MFSHRALLKQAWQVSWKHKYLWFLGLFASLTAAGGSWEYQLMTQNVNQDLINGSYYRLNGILVVATVVKNFLAGLADLIHYDFWTILNALSLLIATFLLLAVFVWLAIVCQAALVGDVKRIGDSKKKEPLMNLRDSLTAGHKHFWSVLALNIMIRIIVSFVFFLIGLPLLFMVIGDSGTLAAVYTVLFVIFIPVAVSLSLLLKYAIAYRVLENRSFVASLERAGRLFRRHWLVSLEMAVILFIINFLASGAIFIVLALFLLPLLLFGLIFKLVWLVMLVMLLAIAIIIVCGSILTTFQVATWTDLFLRLREKGGLAKLERIFQRQS
ncbi:MAG: hypothetical protein WC453_01635 [Patescibacteria group bacterium]